MYVGLLCVHVCAFTYIKLPVTVGMPVVSKDSDHMLFSKTYEIKAYFALNGLNITFVNRMKCFGVIFDNRIA
jgi:hypothetical protein